MQIVVPAAGRGSRFIEQGFTTPKPLIEALGKPLIKWSTDGLVGIGSAKFIFAVREDHIYSHEINRHLEQLYSGCQVVPISEVTEGAACTVLLTQDYWDLDDELVIVNCDNLFLIDIEKARQEAPETAGVIFYIAGRNPHWSYAEIDNQGRVIRVAEKERISDRAIVGCYYFRRARYFLEAAKLMIAQNIRTNGEFYVSPTLNILINQGHLVSALPCDLHYSLGTPEELDSFCKLFDPNYVEAHALVRSQPAA